ncbi:MAG: aminodeoxychorismate/anthranilate synthase component II [Deltaproteobacteria bacterium]
MVLLIDNYDSFTYNLVQMLACIASDPVIKVIRNDEVDISGIDALRPSAIVISPGPGTPSKAGISVAAIRHFGSRIPILGVCLGHQAIAAAFGGKVRRADRIMHGKTSHICHDGKYMFEGLHNPFEAVRYHSLIVDRSSLPSCLSVSAWTKDNEIMGLRHRSYRIEGVQFHPESILTRAGRHIIENFVCGHSDDTKKPFMRRT